MESQLVNKSLAELEQIHAEWQEMLEGMRATMRARAKEMLDHGASATAIAAYREEMEAEMQKGREEHRKVLAALEAARKAAEPSAPQE